MRMFVVFMCVVFSCFACTTKEILILPEASQLPANWGRLSESRLSGSDYPLISGKYLEPPDVIQVNKSGKREFLGIEGSYYGHIPLHIADEIEHKSNVLGLDINELRIRQIDANQFTVAYITARHNLVEHLFNAYEGDFECKEGYIEFPVLSGYEMVEGRTANYQIRNVMFNDLNGALIVQTTIGPYRKYIINSKNIFKEEFYRYKLIGK